MRKIGVKGPVFISIGDKEKLNLFLEKTPKLPKDSLLVDDYSFSAYQTVGYGKIAENPENALKGTKNMQIPKFGFGRWKDYLTSAGKLAPIPAGLKFGQVPEGVLRLGGTLALQKNRILYSYEDGVPGDYPKPEDVLKAFQTNK